jgi:hypothetical protein
MKNQGQISSIDKSASIKLFQLRLWLTHLKSSGENEGESDIGKRQKALFDLKENRVKKSNNTVNKTAMKKFKHFSKLLATLLLIVVGSIGAKAQVGTLTNTGDQTVCIGSVEPYGVVYNTGSTYSWTITPSDGGTISGTSNLIDVSWVKAGTYLLSVIETNATNCEGAPTTMTITVTPLNTIALSSPSGTDSQTICINTPLTSITYATTGATGATVTGLPTGLAGGWASDVVTISGSPTESGTFSYLVTLTGGCGNITATGTITVNPENTIALSSLPGTDSQTVCIDNPITGITYATTGATGATVNGLPTGVTGSWASGIVTITGTPSVSGTFTYTVTTSGGCGVATATGTIEITPANTIALTSPAGTDSQTVCIDTAITNITYATTGATDATVTGLPTGITGAWSSGVVTITGIPSVSGTYTYTITTIGGCGTATTTGVIDVTPANTIALTSAAGTESQTVCIDTAITDITYATTGATGATVNGLPTGVTGSWAGGIVTITGSPSVSGIYTYTVTTIGGCGTATATGVIDVTPANTIALTSAAGTNSQTVCIDTAITNITYATTGATGATVTGLPTGVTGSWAGGIVTITGIPSVSGTYTYTVTTIGGCGTATTTGVIDVTPANTIALASATGTDSQTVCINSPVTNITYATTGATGATVTGLPAGLTGTWATDLVTITGIPTVSGTFTYTITTTGGCGVATITGTVTVMPLPVPTLNGPSPVCELSANNIYNTQTGMINYVWTVTSGGIVTSGGAASDSTITITWTTAGSQTVSVIYTDTYGCTAATPAKYDVTVTPLPNTSPIYHK